MGGFRDAGIQGVRNRRLGEVLGGVGISTGGNTAGTTGTVFGPVVLAGIGGVSLSQSTLGNRATISISADVESGIGLAAGTQTATAGVVVLSNSGGIAFGMSGSTRVTASYDGIRSLLAGPNDATALANGRVLISGFNISVSATGATVNVVNQAAVAVNIFDRTGGNNIVGISSNTDGSGRMLFGQGGIELGYGTTNGTAFYITGSPIRGSMLVNNGYDRGVFPGGVSNSTIVLAPLRVEYGIQATRADVVMDISNSSSAAGSCTLRLALFTMSGSTIGSVSSASRTFGYNSTLASSSYTQISGTRYRSMALGTWDVTPGNYILGFQIQVSTNLTSGTYRVMGGRDISIVDAEFPLGLGSAVPYWNGGISSATSNAFPATIQLSQVVVTGLDDIIYVPFVTLAGTF